MIKLAINNLNYGDKWLLTRGIPCYRCVDLQYCTDEDYILQISCKRNNYRHFNAGIIHNYKDCAVFESLVAKELLHIEDKDLPCKICNKKTLDKNCKDMCKLKLARLSVEKKMGDKK